MTFAATSVSTWVLLAASVASAGIAAYSGYTQAQTSKKIAEHNESVADLAAQDALKRGEKNAMDARKRGSMIEGQQRTALSARGLDLSEGTPNDILGQTDFFTQSDEATARTNARKDAYAAQSQAANYQMQADGTNPGLTLAGGLLSGASSVADRWKLYGTK